MIYFHKDSTNVFYVRVAELRENVGNTYHFTFYHDQQKKLLSINLVDTSSFSYRYSEFTLTLPADLVDMKIVGEYQYKIYEDDTKTNLLYVGKMKLVATPRANVVNNVTIGDNKIYDGE
jgi:hypothetical protein